jgi:dTMP kinase
MPTQPLFLSLDGIDGAGKSTQHRLLCDWLTSQGHQVVACRDPGTTPLGEKIRTLLLDRQHAAIGRRAEMLLYMTARAQLVEEIIRPALDAGKTVVSDRFLLANVVYQGHAGGMNPDDLWQIGAAATQGVEPDLTLVLDMPPEAATRRIERALDHMERQGDEYRSRLRAGFIAEAARRPDRITVINAAQSVEQVHSDIRAAIGRLFSS